jgi:anion-transporting  ArsA/GET3 family ATPase
VGELFRNWPARLHVVTGKGGTGKTSVAAALALALASSGRRTLLTEVESRQGIAQLFGAEPLPYQELRIATVPGGGEVRALAVDPEEALLEYLDMFYKLGAAGRALRKVGAIDFATTIAPGLRDVLLTGKVKEATTRSSDGRRAYDAVVLDAPPTGRIGRFLNVTAETARLAKMGPIKTQSEGVASLLRSPITSVHVVTLLEEMPVQETLDGIAEIRAVPGMQVGGVVINMTRPAVLSQQELKAQPDLAAMAAALSAAGLYDPDPLAAALAEELSEHVRLVELADRERTELEAAGQPIYELPLIAEGIDLAALHKLAAELRDQGAA